MRSSGSGTGAATSRLKELRDWLADVWPTAIPLCALLVASSAPIAVLVFIFMGSEQGALAAIMVALSAILALSLLGRMSIRRRLPAS